MYRIIRPAGRALFSVSHKALSKPLVTGYLRATQPRLNIRLAQQSQLFHVWNSNRRDIPVKETPIEEAIANDKEDDQVDPKHQMLIGFTCKVCEERSHHVMSKLSYTKGVVLIECPGCQNRHLIADNLGWFRDGKTTVEDLVKEKGEGFRKVIVAEDGSEFGGNLMEWLPEIVEDEKQKKAQAKLQASSKKKKEAEGEEEK